MRLLRDHIGMIYGRESCKVADDRDLISSYF